MLVHGETLSLKSGFDKKYFIETDRTFPAQAHKQRLEGQANKWMDQ